MKNEMRSKWASCLPNETVSCIVKKCHKYKALLNRTDDKTYTALNMHTICSTFIQLKHLQGLRHYQQSTNHNGATGHVTT